MSKSASLLGPYRPLANGILWHVHTGAPWPDTPSRYGPWQTVYDRFNRWRKDGTWAKILDAPAPRPAVAARRAGPATHGSQSMRYFDTSRATPRRKSGAVIAVALFLPNYSQHSWRR